METRGGNRGPSPRAPDPPLPAVTAARRRRPGARRRIASRRKVLVLPPQIHLPALPLVRLSVAPPAVPAQRRLRGRRQGLHVHRRTGAAAVGASGSDQRGRGRPGVGGGREEEEIV